MKTCCRCHKTKEIAQFSVKRAARDGRCHACKECLGKSNRAYWAANRDKFNEKSLRFRQRHPDRVRQWRRRYRLRSNYGLTPEQVETMLRDQNGLCAVKGCGRKAAHIDHCHATGKVRGLLCPHCNRALGHLGDSVERIQGLIAYLTK